MAECSVGSYMSGAINDYNSAESNTESNTESNACSNTYSNSEIMYFNFSVDSFCAEFEW